MSQTRTHLTLAPQFFLAAVLLVIGSVSFAAEIEFTDCEISNTSGQMTMQAECAELLVPENYAEPNGKQIKLSVAKIKSLSNRPEQDPFTMIAGGPGQAAIESFIGVRGAFRKIRQYRDIYLIDQRGTGQSNQMQCKPADEDYADPFEYDPETVAQFTKDCLNDIPGDPRYYTTSVAVKDLDAVRAALGVPQWNVYGVSYGTRVAQHYLRRYPDSIRTMILDAVAPPQVNLGPDIATESQRAIEQMASRCAENEQCNALYPDLSARTQALIEELRQQPKQIRFENFSTGEIEEIEFGPMHVAMTMRLMAYSAYGVAILPSMLHNAYEKNNFGPLARQSVIVSEELGNSMSLGMHNSVICSEDLPYIDVDKVDREALENTYLGIDAWDSLLTICKLWPSGVVDEDFKQIVQSDRPVLVLSGSIDPITPPAYADMIMPGLSNGLHIVLPEQGHMQAGVGCMPTVMAKFIEEATVNELDQSCLQRQTPEPFFVNANGPSP